jgi:hypothetical protein
MTEKKMRDLLAQGYSIKQIAVMLGMAEDFIQEVVDDRWGQFDFGSFIGRQVLVKEKQKAPLNERVIIGTGIAIVKGISNSGDQVMLENPGFPGISRWVEAKNLKIVRESGEDGNSPAGETGPATDGISSQLKSFCIDYITALGEVLDLVIRVGHQEHEAGFNEAMHFLSRGRVVPGDNRSPFLFGVLEQDRPQMLAKIKQSAKLAGIPYDKLSPLNQFIMAITPYVYYCLEKYLPNAPGLREEARHLMNTSDFPRYLQETLGYSISQEIKGAFWNPKPLGFLASIFGFGHRH